MSKSQKQPASRRLRPRPLPEFKMARKLLVIYDDPHATESSDDEYQSVPTEKKKLGKIRKCITEIPLPPLVPVISGSAETSSFAEKRINMSSNNVEVHNKKRVSTQNPSTRKQPSCKFRGVRLRESGRWSAEICGPFKGGRFWLGTYNTAEEASQAYESKRLEIEPMAKARVPNNGSSDKGPASNSSSANAAAAAAEGSASEKPSAEANDMVAELAGLEIPDLSLLSLPPTPPAAAVVPTGSKPNPVLDFDFLADYAGQGFDDDTNLGGGLEDIPNFGFDNNERSQLPDFDFGDFDSDGFAG